LADKRSVSLNGPFIVLALLVVAVVILAGLTRGTSLEDEYALYFLYTISLLPFWREI
jgi:hypothetical protein